MSCYSVDIQQWQVTKESDYVWFNHCMANNLKNIYNKESQRFGAEEVEGADGTETRR